jgi:thioredoxin 1
LAFHSENLLDDLAGKRGKRGQKGLQAFARIRTGIMLTVARFSPQGATMASEKVQVFNDLNFDQEVVNSSVPVLVDFTATWCGPCKVDDSPITAGKFGVRGVPTIMVFKNGQRAAQHVGLTTKAKLLELVNG